MQRLLALMLAVVLCATACGDDGAPTDAGGPGTGDPSTTTSSSTTTTVTTTTAAPTTTLDPSSPEGALAAARERWADNGLTSYRMTTAEVCFCPETVWVHTVLDGELIAHAPVTGDTPYDPGPRSMETLFDEIAAAIDEGYETLEAEYDPETGAVVRYWVDVAANIADEEHGVEVTDLVPYDPEFAPVAIDATELTVDYGCGYGFAKGNVTQTLALVIYHQAAYEPGGPDVTAPIELPDDQWNATVTTGADLFANWCDDVVEPHEPTPVTAETWTLVDGTLTVTSGRPADCAGGAVTATLSGAVIESATGDRVDLADVELTNTGWGCFAG